MTEWGIPLPQYDTTPNGVRNPAMTLFETTLPAFDSYYPYRVEVTRYTPDIDSGLLVVSSAPQIQALHDVSSQLLRMPVRISSAGTIDGINPDPEHPIFARMQLQTGLHCWVEYVPQENDPVATMKRVRLDYQIPYGTGFIPASRFLAIEEIATAQYANPSLYTSIQTEGTIRNMMEALSMPNASAHLHKKLLVKAE